MSEVFVGVVAAVMTAVLMPVWGLLGLVVAIGLAWLAAVCDITVRDRLRYGNWIWETRRWP